MTALKIHKPWWLKLFLIIVLLEIFLGGGGRLLDIGPISLRMYLFMACIALGVILCLALKEFSRNFLLILSLITFLFIFAAAIGYINGAKISMISNDIKPLLSIYSLIFFYCVIQTKNDILLCTRLIKFSAVMLAIFYIAMFTLLNTNKIPFQLFYSKVAETNEFFFRNKFIFFYKGFIYISIGLFFYIAEPHKRYYKTLILLIGALILTYTRGFLLSIVLVYLFYTTIILKKGVRLIITLVFLTVIFFTSWEILNNAKVINRKLSDSSRITQIEEVLESTSLRSAFIGHGFGIGVPSRPDRMEIAYLEIFHKQGFIGLSFWAFMLWFCWILYKSAVANGNFTLATPFILSVILIYVQSFTNPFLNNPIGLTMIVVAMVSLNVLSQKEMAFD